MTGLPKTYASGAGGTLIQSGTLATRPIAGVADRYYLATDVLILFRDTGVAWTIAGSSYYEMTSRLPFEIPSNGADNSVANQAFYQLCMVKEPCQLVSIGVNSSTVRANGNIDIGLYDDTGALAPRNRLCSTGSINMFANLVDSGWNFTVPTTLPYLPAGPYWAAISCDSAYDAGIANSGFLIRRHWSPYDVGYVPDVIANLSYLEGAAFPLPAVATGVGQGRYTYTLMLKLAPIV